MILALVYFILTGQANYETYTIDVLLHVLLVQIWIPYTKYYATLNGLSWYLCASFSAICVFRIFLTT